MLRRLLAIMATVAAGHVAPAAGQSAAPPASLYLGVALGQCTKEGGTISVPIHTSIPICTIPPEACESKGWNVVHKLSHSGSGQMVWDCLRP
jgi:hypothetical protein